MSGWISSFADYTDTIYSPDSLMSQPLRGGVSKETSHVDLACRRVVRVGCQNCGKPLEWFLALLFFLFFFFPEEWREQMLISITVAVSNCSVYVHVSWGVTK